MLCALCPGLKEGEGGQEVSEVCVGLTLLSNLPAMESM